MLNNLFVAVNAVIPLFFLMVVGIYVKRSKVLTELELTHVNRMVFKVFFFFMMFYNIYIADPANSFRPGLMLYGALGVIAEAIFATVFVYLIEKENYKRGAMAQAIFRSNYVLMGIPLVNNIYGNESLPIPTMMIAIIVPLYNIAAVIVLETFRGGHFNLLPIIKGILKNPMILGGLLALLLRLLNVDLPRSILKPASEIAAATTPVALIILGASFKGGSFHAHLKQLVTCTLFRLVVMPTIMLSLAIYLGFRDIELITLVAVFASPCAVVSFAMAQQMGSDADLAGNCVVYTSALSCLTLFTWVFILKTFTLV